MSIYLADAHMTTRIVAMTCGECGVVFGMADDFKAAREKDGKTWYCPNGHARHYIIGKTEAQREKERAEWLSAQLTHERDQRQAAERTAAAHKGHATRLRKRAAAGVCPCCQRTFQNVARHMTGQHPEFVKQVQP